MFSPVNQLMFNAVQKGSHMAEDDLVGLVTSINEQLGGIPAPDPRTRLEYEFKTILLQISSDQEYAALLMLSEKLIEKEILDNSFTLLLLEELAEYLPVWRLSFVIKFLECQYEHLTKNLSSGKGRGLILLRLCNDLIRRLSKSQDATLCGRFLLFISKVFPSSERSGVNLRGDMNVDNVTSIEESDLEDVDDIYSSFWKLQFFFLHPLESLSLDNWPRIRKTFERALHLFQNARPVTMAEEANGSEYYPKFLSARCLFDLQIADCRWRDTILIQMAIFSQHLLTFSAPRDVRTPTSKVSSPTSVLLNDEQKKWIIDIKRRVVSLLSTRGDSTVFKWVLRMENNWMNWKANSCPLFEKEPCPALLVSQELRPDMSVANMMDPELLMDKISESRLDGISGAQPTLQQLLCPLSEQLHASPPSEPNYFYSRDEVFRWKILRLIASGHADPDLFPKCVAPEGIEALSKTIMDEDEVIVDNEVPKIV